MLPFGHNFGISRPNLFGQGMLIPSIPVIVSTNAAIPTNASNFFSTSQPQPPMMIAPGILNSISNTTPNPTSSGKSTPNPDAIGSPVDSQWSEHRASDGRIYYYNRVLKQSSWTKPDELKTPEEREKTLWKEYKTPEGKPYFYNTKTMETTWSRPEALKANKEKKKDGDASKNTDIEKAMAATLKSLEKSNVSKANEVESSAKNKSKERLTEETEHPELSHEENMRLRAAAKFRDFIRDKYTEGRITTSSSWEQALKYLQHDPRFMIITKMSERKQIFNAWKVQRAKEEREEKRLAIKKAKEDLEKWLLNNPKMKYTLRYHKAESLFGSEELWRAVSEHERREIFDDVQRMVKKRDEKAKEGLRTRNIKTLSEILDGIDEINHRTTWAQAQRILIENSDFANDSTLQGMDKEDALVVFQDHIRKSEKLFEEEKTLETKRKRRKERKVREAFVYFLRELHSKGHLTSVSTWSYLYPTISADHRFEDILVQPGSTALDLFKFYVEDLKNQYYADRNTIRDILKELNVSVTTNTTFDQLQEWVRTSEKGQSIDLGNMKFCYNSLFDKAHTKEREYEREAQKKQARLESAFRNLLRSVSPPIEPTSKWSEIREKIENSDGFGAVSDEELRHRFFNNYIKSISEACGHHHASSGKRKKKDKKKRKRRDDVEEEVKSKKSRKITHRVGEEEGEKRKRSSKQHSRHHRQTPPESGNEDEMKEEKGNDPKEDESGASFEETSTVSE